MESNELLEQEEAFHKLNAEIELRTRQLMKNVEAVINKQTSKHWNRDNLEEKHLANSRMHKKNGAIPDYNDGDLLESDIFEDPIADDKIYRQFNTTGNRRPRNTIKGVEQKKKELLDSGLLPYSAKGMSAESMVRFLKAKGKLLQEEYEQVKRELQTKNEELKKAHQEIKNRDDEKQKLLSDITTLRDRLKKVEVNLSSQLEKLHMRDSENILLKKEIELLNQDVKRLNIAAAGHEAKLNKSREESDKLKLLLKQSETNEKEARDRCRSKSDEMVAVVRKLEKQKSDLMSAVKKQIVLIDNFKKQKELLEIERGLNFTEKEFLKMLEEKGTEDKTK